MIDPVLAVGILFSALLLGLFVHLLIPYAGRAAVVAWLILMLLLGAWTLWWGDTIFQYTWLVTMIPAGLLLLLLGLPFEIVRRRHTRQQGDLLRAEGVFACPHCGFAYDRAREDDRCPDCGGAAEGAPGVLG